MNSSNRGDPLPFLRHNVRNQIHLQLRVAVRLERIPLCLPPLGPEHIVQILRIGELMQRGGDVDQPLWLVHQASEDVRRDDIHKHLRRHLGVCCLADRPEIEAGIVDDHVKGAECVGFLRELLRFRETREVRNQGPGRARAGLFGLNGARGAPGVQVHGVTFLDELTGRSEAKAVSLAGDEDAGHAGCRLFNRPRFGGTVLKWRGRGHFLSLSL
ncbi:hypothetical protein BDV11DRAFT_195485 [Aspergillus similis]